MRSILLASVAAAYIVGMLAGGTIVERSLGHPGESGDTLPADYDDIVVVSCASDNDCGSYSVCSSRNVCVED